MSSQTVLRVADVIPSPKMRLVIVLVMVLHGDPTMGMELISPQASGRWKIGGFASGKCDSSTNDLPSLMLSLVVVKDGSRLMAGMTLGSVV